MKTQKFEIEIKVFDGYEFDGYRRLKLPEDMNAYVFFDCPEDEDHLNPISGTPLSAKHKYFIYKKKQSRKIIYEEVREDYLNRGDFYRDYDGDVNMWISYIQSSVKRPILKKVHDDFEVK